MVLKRETGEGRRETVNDVLKNNARPWLALSLAIIALDQLTKNRASA